MHGPLAGCKHKYRSLLLSSTSSSWLRGARMVEAGDYDEDDEVLPADWWWYPGTLNTCLFKLFGICVRVL